VIYKIFKTWILLAFVTTALCGLVYLAVQQSLRMGANDPQIQMAEDAATQFQTGPSPQTAIASGTVNINESLSPYLIFYDPSGNPIAGTGILDGVLPNLPTGIFDYALKHGEDRLTWQPEPGVRQAIVVVPIINSTHPGFVMAGRSLREVEIRENQALTETTTVWLATILGLTILLFIFASIEKHICKS
jgi:hypothetical protein